MNKIDVSALVKETDYSRETDYLVNHPLVSSFLKENNLTKEALEFDAVKLYRAYSKYPSIKTQQEMESLNEEFIPYLCLDDANNVVVEYRETDKAVLERKVKQKRENFLYNDMPNVFNTYSLKTFNGLDKHDLTKSAVALSKLDNWLKNRKNPNLFLWGPSSSGKTMFSSCLANDLLDEGYSLVYIDVLLFTSEFFRSDYQRKDILEKIPSCDVLVMDGLGVEKVTQDWLDMLLGILKLRNEEAYINIFTSSYSPDLLKEHYSRTTFKEDTREKAGMIINRINSFEIIGL